MAYSFPSSPICPNAYDNAISDASVWRINSLLKSGYRSTGGVVSIFLN